MLKKERGALRCLESYRLGVCEPDPIVLLVESYVCCAGADEFFELLRHNDCEHLRRIFEGLLDRFDHFQFALFVWNDPDGDWKNTIMLTLFDTSV